MCADVCTTNQARVVLVEVDVTVPLVREVQIMDRTRKLAHHKVLFEWAPPFCNKCKAVGHNCDMKTKAKSKKAKQVWVPKKASTDEQVQEVTLEVEANVEEEPCHTVARRSRPMH